MNRLENILKNLVQQHTAQLVIPSEDFNDRVEQIAQRLAREGVLLLVGDLPEELRTKRADHVQGWVNAYAELYYLFGQGLFGANDEPVAYFADDKYPLIIVFRAKTIPVIDLMAGLIVPYVALRQSDGQATRAELRGLVEMALDDMEGSDLPQEQYHSLRTQGIELLSQLLQSRIHQVSLTEFKRPFIVKMQAFETPAVKTHRPDSLPELPQQRAEDTQPAPLPPNVLKLPRREDIRSASKPPVPGLLNRTRRQS